MKDAIFKIIDESEALAIELESGLCTYPAISPESGGEGELDKIEFLSAWLKDHGITSLERYDAPDSRAKGGVRPNLLATLGEGDGKSHGHGEGCLWIISHVDVVPPGEASLWKSDPWTVTVSDAPSGKGKILSGRGVEDNQQGLVSSVIAALALSRAGIKPSRPVKLLFAADEENGSVYGMEYMVKNHPELFNKNDVALIPDGGDAQGDAIEIAEKNILWLKFKTIGEQTHGSRPDLGKNAFLAASDLALRLTQGLGKQFDAKDPLFEPPFSTFAPTKKEANVPNVNTIPGDDVFYMDMRILPCYPIKEVLAAIETIKKTVETEYGVRISYDSSQATESKATSPEAPFIKQLSGAVEEVYGVKPHCVGIGGGTVASFLRNRDIASAVWCKIDSCAHQPNEFAQTANILGDAKVMASLMLSSGS
jgi:succinyl-diaminopimelate desuccinylase